MMILSLILFLVFCVLSGFHFYWLFGGKWGSDKVFPTKINEPITYTIPPFATLVVAIGLFTFGLLYLSKSGLYHLQLPNWIEHYAYWVIPTIFMLRAIGEFKYVGFFKKIKTTDFADADTKLFSPLCFAIALTGISIQLIS